MNKDEGGMGVWGAAAANYRHCACRLRQLDLMYTEVAEIKSKSKKKRFLTELLIWLSDWSRAMFLGQFSINLCSSVSLKSASKFIMHIHGLHMMNSFDFNLTCKWPKCRSGRLKVACLFSPMKFFQSKLCLMQKHLLSMDYKRWT